MIENTTETPHETIRRLALELADKRQKREQAEQQILNRESRWEEIGKLYDYGLAQQVQLRSQLLAAQVAIEKKDEALLLCTAISSIPQDYGFRCGPEFDAARKKAHQALAIKPDLSLLHARDAELIDSARLEQARDDRKHYEAQRKTLVELLEEVRCFIANDDSMAAVNLEGRIETALAQVGEKK